MQINWDAMPSASEDAKAGADLVVRTADGQERRTAYDGGHITLVDGTHTSSNKQAASAGVLTHLTIDGQGAGTDTNYRRGLPVDVFDGSTLRANATGDAYNINLAMQISKASSSDAFAEIDVGIGSDYSTIVFRDRRALIKGSGINDALFFNGTIIITDAIARYGARFYMNASTDVLLWNKTIQIQRTFTP